MEIQQLERDQDIIFISDTHKEFYHEKLKEVRRPDVYHKALVYCLGINHDTRSHISNIYDFKTGSIKTQCLHEGWQTGGSVKVTRMAFNLYCNCAPSTDEYSDNDQKECEYAKYLPDELFCCSYAPFFWQAIKIRYPDETTYNHELHARLGSLD